ncbi:MAG: hypothetical protein WAS21_08105 [Geminicoccaceae bacterium]
MTRRAKALLALLLVTGFGLSGCVIPEREEVVVHEPYHAPSYWVPGHYGPYGYWHPGRWR